MEVQIEKQLMQWMRASMDLNSDKCIAPERKDWLELYRTIFEQGLGPVMFPLIAQIPEIAKEYPEEFEPWRKQIISAVTLQFYRFEQIKEILRAFDQNKIPVIMFKGLAVARFYEKYENRLMSDMDILVRPEHKHQAATLLGEMGYKIAVDEDDHPMHLGFEKKGSIYVELHTALFFPGYMNVSNLDQWYQHIWENSQWVTVDTLDFHAMAVEDELINQLIHFAVHFVYRGGRLKHLYDIGLLIKKNSQLNWDYIEKMLKEMQLWDFGQFICCWCHDNLGVEIPAAMTITDLSTSEKFMHILVEENTSADIKGHMVAWRYYSKRLPQMCKLRVMSPFVWLSEFFIQLKIHGLNLAQLWVSAKRNMNLFYKKAALIRGLGLSR